MRLWSSVCLAFAVVLVALFLCIGFVGSRYLHAQRLASAPIVVADDLPPSLPPPSPSEPALPGTTEYADGPAIPSGKTVDPEKLPPVSAAPAASAPDPNNDPEQAATALVDDTRQKAQASVKALKAEALALRARLKKIEAAIQRLDGLLSALDAKEAFPQRLETSRPIPPSAPHADPSFNSEVGSRR